MRFPWRRARATEPDLVPDFSGEPEGARQPVPTELSIRYAHRNLAVTSEGLGAL